MKHLKYLILLSFITFVSCQANNDHGHSHDESGGHSHSHDDGPSESHTAWTDQTELFVEFPALVVGQVSRFAAHFTTLSGHQPVTEGSVTVSLIKGSKGIRQKVDGPSSPGIFGPSLKPAEAGIYQLVFDVVTPAYTDKIILKDVQVFASEAEAEKALGGEEENGNEISFLKEQAWKMEFGTAPVVRKEVYEVISTYGIWKVAASDDQILMAPANGQVKFKPRYLAEGQVMQAGQVLMEVVSSDLTTGNLGAEVRKAQASLEQAKASFERISELYESKIRSKSDFDLAKEKYLLAQTNYETLTAGFTGKGKQVIAPFNGYILDVLVNNGEYANQGDVLMKVTKDENHILQTRVNTNHARALEHIHNLRYQNGEGEWSSLNGTGGEVISVSREVSSSDPLLSIYSKVQEEIHMPDGSYTEVQIEVGEPSLSMVIPTSALLEDYGQYSVIVQLSGESFERRNVTCGKRNGSEVEILRGLNVGEVVVTKGAYQVKMASMSGQAPAHGHAH